MSQMCTSDLFGSCLEVVKEFACRRLHQHSASKSPEMVPVFLLFGGVFNRTLGLTLQWQGVKNPNSITQHTVWQNFIGRLAPIGTALTASDMVWWQRSTGFWLEASGAVGSTASLCFLKTFNICGGPQSSPH